MKPLYQGICFVVICFAMVTIGCATQNISHTESLTSADLSIKAAENSNATLYAPMELKLARDKINAAKEAAEKEEFVQAKRLADEAVMDAKLAEAKALSERTKKITQEMRDSIETLRREIERIQKQ